MGKAGNWHIWFNSAKYLVIVDYFPRFPVIRLISNMTANTICSDFTRILSEYGLPSHIHADFGTQYISKEFRKMCDNSGIKLTFSSPYHHQVNSVAQRAIVTCKSIWKKTLDEKKCPYSAMWMYRTTPLSHNMPSPYELMYGRKPRILIPSSNHVLQSAHADNLDHRDMNQLYQEKQAEYYKRKASQTERRPLHANELVFVYNTLTKTWHTGKIMNIPSHNNKPKRSLHRRKGWNVVQKNQEDIWDQDLFIKKHQIKNSIQCLHLP